MLLVPIPTIKARTAKAVVIPAVDTAAIETAATKAAIAAVSPDVVAANTTANNAAAKAEAARNAADGVAATLAADVLTQAQKDDLQDTFANALDGSFGDLVKRVDTVDVDIASTRLALDTFRNDTIDTFQGVEAQIAVIDATLTTFETANLAG